MGVSVDVPVDVPVGDSVLVAVLVGVPVVVVVVGVGVPVAGVPEVQVTELPSAERTQVIVEPVLAAGVVAVPDGTADPEPPVGDPELPVGEDPLAGTVTATTGMTLPVPAGPPVVVVTTKACWVVPESPACGVPVDRTEVEIGRWTNRNPIGGTSHRMVSPTSAWVRTAPWPPAAAAGTGPAVSATGAPTPAEGCAWTGAAPPASPKTSPRVAVVMSSRPCPIPSPGPEGRVAMNGAVLPTNAPCWPDTRAGWRAR